MNRDADLTIEVGYTNRNDPNERLSGIVFMTFSAIIPIYVFITLDAIYAPWKLHLLEGLDLVNGLALLLFLVLCLAYLAYLLMLFFFRKYGFTLEKSATKAIFWRKLFFRHSYYLQDFSKLNQVLLANTHSPDSPFMLFLKKSEDNWENKKSKKPTCGILLGQLSSEQQASKVGQQISSYLNFPLVRIDKTFNDNFLNHLDDYANQEINISYKPLWLKSKVLLPLILLGLAVAVYTTPLWELPFVLVLNPSFSATHNHAVNKQARSFRIYSAGKLKSAHSEIAILNLLRLVNTIDPQEQNELMLAAMSSLSQISGIQIPAQRSDLWDQSISLINQWASDRLSLPLDQNGGVLLWFDLVPDMAAKIDEIAGPDSPGIGWTFLGLAEFFRREDWLHWVGKAFNDPRPLSHPLVKAPNDHFSILRANESMLPNRKVVAETVGVAIAIKFWTSLSEEDRGSKYFPADFRKWWADYAAAHRLPPLP